MHLGRRNFFDFLSRAATMKMIFKVVELRFFSENISIENCNFLRCESKLILIYRLWLKEWLEIG